MLHIIWGKQQTGIWQNLKMTEKYGNLSDDDEKFQLLYQN